MATVNARWGAMANHFDFQIVTTAATAFSPMSMPVPQWARPVARAEAQGPRTGYSQETELRVRDNRGKHGRDILCLKVSLHDRQACASAVPCRRLLDRRDAVVAVDALNGRFHQKPCDPRAENASPVKVVAGAPISAHEPAGFGESGRAKQNNTR